MKTNQNSLTSEIFALRQYLLNKVPYKIIFIVTGLLATLWFLFRVIPKPSRAGYPCMQAAAPLMSGFVLYLLSFTGSFFAFRKAKSLLNKNSYSKAVILLFVGVVLASAFFVVSNYKSDAIANIMVVAEPPDGPNNPMGTGQGIFPGRVVWAHNPDATDENCDNTPGNSFWDYHNNDTLVIRNMVEQSLVKLTGTDDYPSVWDSIFTNHNRKKYNESRGYQNDEKIFIKINQGTSKWILNGDEQANGFTWPTSGTIQPSWRQKHYAATETGPFVVLNILRQLVHEAGVPQENISIGDPMAHIFGHNFQPWYNEFPNVKYIDQYTDEHNRTFVFPATEASMNYSDEGETLDETSERYFEIMENADYMINVACLKPHIRAGVTLCTKNHFGSITRDGASHLHPSLISISDQGWDQSNEGYNKYRVMVDIMGHKYLGANTMLFVIEGLFGGGANETHQPVKWNSDPFNGDWTNSILMSFDQVALESVAFDILRNEYDGVFQPEDHPNWFGVDDYLHQAADPDQWPEGFTYNPDGQGPLTSLGVHEHWNNDADRQYSRNLGTAEGIELVTTDGSADPVAVEGLQWDDSVFLSAYPNPFSNQVNLQFDLQQPGEVSIVVLDMQGRIVATITDNRFSEGSHQINWNAANTSLQNGFYMIRLQMRSQGKLYNKNFKIQHIKH